jgi:hypothetical protein
MDQSSAIPFITWCATEYRRSRRRRLVSGFEVIALGVGDTFSEVHTTASLLLEAEGVRLAVDCPDRYRGVLKKNRERTGRALSLEDVDPTFITHVHGDHMNGLEGVAFYKRFAENKRLRLHTTSEVRDVLWAPAIRESRARLEGHLWPWANGRIARRRGARRGAPSPTARSQVHTPR